MAKAYLAAQMQEEGLSNTTTVVSTTGKKKILL